MKEVTRVITAQITGINKVDDNLSQITSKDMATRVFVNGMKAISGADDIVILNIQDFIRDIDEKAE